MKKNKGFTLIELLVVIAIIGILASVVLASLSSARTKAKVAALQSTLSSTRAQAEIGVSTNGKYVADLCQKGATSGGLKALIDSLNKSASKVKTIKCISDAADAAGLPMKWAVEATIPYNGADVYYCADSTGYAGLSGGATAGTTSVIGGAATAVPSGTGIPSSFPGASADFSCAS